MARVYICPVVLETGRTDPETGAPLPDLQYASLTGVVGVTRCRAAISVNLGVENRGRSKLNWSLCYVEANDWTQVDAEPNTIHLTAEILDGETPNRVKVQLRNAGVLTQGESNSFSGTVRELVRFLLRKHYPETTDEQIRRQFGGLI